MSHATLLDTLSARHCTPCAAGTPPLTGERIDQALADLDGWQHLDDHIEKTYRFSDYYHTMAFVNAVAWIANQEDHHPDLEVGYNRCVVKFSTHSVGGISENDLICAARVEQLGA